MTEETQRIIKKYPNRRIYDTHESSYITLNDVRNMIIKGVNFKVIDAQTKTDITRNILLQIIIEQESENNPLFSTDNLQDFIKYYGKNQGQNFSSFINQSLTFFQQQQEQFQSSMGNMLEQNPMQVWTEIGKQNMKMWQGMQKDWFSNISKKTDKAG